MKIEGELTYWGMNVDKNESRKTKELLGLSLEMTTAGADGDITRKRNNAVELIEDPERGRKNARQTILMHKGGHGSGVMPDFPTSQQIEQAMEGHEPGHLVTAYGDGSHTSPKTWWAALGGYGTWVPRWDIQGESLPHRADEDSFGPALGQTGSSTRHELMGWICDPLETHKNHVCD